MSSEFKHSWICAQLGSREHYTVPRLLHQQERLRLFLTDFWSPDTSLWRILPGSSQRKKMKERFAPDLADAPVVSLGNGRLAFDLRQRLLGRNSWETILRRNEWFQDRFLRLLRGPLRDVLDEGEPGIFFSYSYTARKLFEFFRAEGWRTVLGQIDPGPYHEEVTKKLESETGFCTSWDRPPPLYWERWRRECELADVIWANSAWSKEALLRAGIPGDKIRVMPLVYSNGSDESCQPRTYPASFSPERPLRVLFLGQVNLQKGVHLLLRAVRKLAGAPIELWIVGPSGITVPEEFRRDPRIRLTGPVSRKETVEYYDAADLFAFPTFSDGFGLTQLEAQARRLPLLASRFCGEVLRDGQNGLLIDPLDEDTLTRKLRYCLENPQALAAFSGDSRVEAKFRLPALAGFLDELSAPRPVAPATSDPQLIPGATAPY